MESDIFADNFFVRIMLSAVLHDVTESGGVRLY